MTEETSADNPLTVPEADLAEQRAPVTEQGDDAPAPTTLPWLADDADALEQQTPLGEDDDELRPRAGDNDTG